MGVSRQQQVEHHVSDGTGIASSGWNSVRNGRPGLQGSLQRHLKAFSLLLLLVLALGLAGCAAPPPPPPPPAPPPPRVDETVEGAVNGVLLDLVRQLGPQAGAARTVVIDPLIDGRTGQQTGATRRAMQALTAAVPRILPMARLLTFDETGARQSNWLLNGTLSERPGAEGRFLLTLALSDRAGGLVIARGVAPVSDPQLDPSPTRFYSESPSLVRDRAIQGYIDTTERPVGQPADALYLAQVPTAALLAEAQDAYNNERWEDSLRLMTAAAARDDGRQMRTFNGLYMANMKLGRTADAEVSFGQIATLGLTTSNLAVKILFQPGTTDFLGEPEVYAMWLRQIARAAQQADLCLNVVGHTSKTGTESGNRILSQRRAQSVRDRLVRDAPPLARGQRVRTEGRGWDETIVGSGTDDLRDALDRRVEFKVIDCS
jgi:outer membrane protein OmpA-like peptidoglycan-associated protein